MGKLDTWEEAKKGIPDDLAQIAFPLAPEAALSSLPRFDDIAKETEPLDGQPVREASHHALIIYTSGSTGRPKGVLHSFQTISEPTRSLVNTLSATHEDRMLSYLPLATPWTAGCRSA